MHLLSFVPRSVLVGAAAVLCAAVPMAATATAMECPTCANNPCVAGDASEAFHYPHCSFVDKFIQCSASGECFEMPCAPGTVWDDVAKTCNFAWAGCDSNDCVDCFSESGDVGCDCNPCEALVCSSDSFCCDGGSWDGSCVDLALELCQPVCPAALPVCDSSDCSTCLSLRDEPGCDCDPCEDLVCDADEFCCDNEWDAYCVLDALYICEPLCTAPVLCDSSECSTCLSSRVEPGCDCLLCEEAVCQDDPQCCNEAWNDVCVREALDLCEPVCPSSDADPLPLKDVARGTTLESAAESAAYDCTEMFDYAIASKNPTDDYISTAPLAVFSTNGTMVQSWEEVIDSSSNRFPLPRCVKCALEEIDQDGLYDVSVTMVSDFIASLGMDTSGTAKRIFVLWVNIDD